MRKAAWLCLPFSASVALCRLVLGESALPLVMLCAGVILLGSLLLRDRRRLAVLLVGLCVLMGSVCVFVQQRFVIRPAEEPQPVSQCRQDDIQVLPAGLGTAGQVDDQRGAADPRRRTAEHAVWGDLHGLRPHGLRDARRHALTDGAGRLGRQIPRPEPGAARCENNVYLALVSQADQVLF